MQIVYIGKCADGRRIPNGDQQIHAKKGEPVEVPDAIAQSLLKNPADWQVAGKED